MMLRTLLQFLPLKNEVRHMSCTVQRLCTKKSSGGKHGTTKNDAEHLPEPTDDDAFKDYKLLKMTLLSRRLDNVTHKATNSNTSTTEKLILSGKVRVNERIIKKKSHGVEKDDEIDIWISQYEENPELANIKRLQIHNLIINPDGYNFVIKYWKNLVVFDWKKNK